MEDNQQDNDDYVDSDSSSSDKKKRKNNSLKLKALGKKRTSDWIIDKEIRKNFFNDI